jgi:hypothetical protein
MLAVAGVATWAAIPIPTASTYSQNFDGMGIPATSTSASSLPADFRLDTPSTVRTVGTFSSAGTTTARAGGANLSSSAANGSYNFGSGTATLGGSDRAVGFVSSGTATASGNLYAQFANNTGSALSGLQISYSVEKYRGGSNPAGFRIQLFYSTDGSTWTNAGASFLTAFSADAANTGFATAPGATVAVSSTLNVAIANNSNFFLAWNYSVSSGTTTTNAQALAVDDITVRGVTAGPTNPSGVGAASPNTVQAGNSTLLTVAVTPGANPTSTGLQVSADLSSIGGSASQQFFDDGTHGDSVAGDNVFSFQATVPSATVAGSKTLPATITDVQGRSAGASISLTVTPASTPPSGTGNANPNSLQPGTMTLLTVNVTPGTNPTSTNLAVNADLSSIGGSASQQFFDDGSHGDANAGNNVFSFQAQVSSGTSPGAKSLAVTISDSQNRSSSASISLTVQPPPPPTTLKISQVYGGGGNSGSTYKNDFIELYNLGSTPVDLTSWSVQYNSAGATTGNWQVTSICPNGPCIVQPGHYFLVQEALGTGGTTSLPAADFAGGAINMSATNGKVALVASTIALNGQCPANGLIVDLVGYGTANCFETAATGALTNTTAAVRRGNGCIDTDNNTADFVTISPIPRNSASPVNGCGGDPTQPSALGTASPAGVLPAANTLLTVHVTPAGAPPSTGVQVNADLSSIGGNAAQPFFDDATNGDQTATDNTFSFRATVGATISTGVKNIVATVTDAQSHSTTAPITLTIQSPTCGVERWSVKTGTDPDSQFVDLNNFTVTGIGDLGAIPAPADPPGPPLNQRIMPTETTVWVVNAMMTLYKLENDVDYHIVLQDFNDSTKTMIAEIPSPACVGAASPFAAGISGARQKFDARFNATDQFQTANIPVRVKGVGFFDFIHGQTGVAPNGIELHPVLDIFFTANTSTTLASSANPSIYAQPLTITAMVTNGGTTVPTGHVGLLDGGNTIAVAMLDGSGQATFNLNNLAAGAHSLTASYEGDETSAPSTSAALNQTVNKADQSINFAPLANRTYGDPDFNVSAPASSGLAVSFSVTAGPITLSGNSVHITGAGSATIRASQGGNNNYNPAPDIDQSFTIAQAAQSISFAPLADKTYGDAPFTVSATGGASGNPVTFAASGNCTAGSGDGSTITITGGGFCTVTASQAGNGNYQAAPDVPRTFAINQAAAHITVNGYSGIYDGHPHGAGGSATGANGEDLSSLLNFGSVFTDVPGGTAHWTFAGNANYLAASGDASITITQASAGINVNGYTGTYDGHAHGASGTAIGVNGEDLSSLLNLGASFTDVPGGTAHWSFTGSINYASAGGNATITITQAGAHITLNGYSGVYDGHVHGASGTATGVNGEDLSGLLSLGAGFTDVPGGTAHWTFAGNTDYASASGDVAISITRAGASITVNGFTGAYDGQPHGATGTATGVNGENLSALLNLGASFTTVPGGTAHWTFGGNTDYASAAGDAAITINRATPLFSNLTSTAILAGTASTTLSGRVTLGTLVPTGSVAITLNGVTQGAAIQPDGGFASSFATGSLAPINPPYAITYSYGGDNNFNFVTGAGTLTVNYGIVPLFDQTKAAKSGSTIPIKLELTNAGGGNISSASIAVTAIRLVQVSSSATFDVMDSGNANPDNNFRYDGSGYIFNLGTNGLGTGTYELVFTVSGDPSTHTVAFQVR